MTKEAWVTVVTNDTYGLGALVLGSSLRRVGTTRDTVVMVTPGVSDRMREELSRTFTAVIPVDVLDSGDSANLALMSRPELGVTLTKLHAWTLIQYAKCVFLDADTMLLENCDELFEREELSAAPDPGWPDIFNSGVFVFVPSLETYQALLDFAVAHGSFDGGDQGLLNMFFKGWATEDIKKRLPFIYNVVASTAYTYIPALKYFGDQVKIVHFLGSSKPWSRQAESSSSPFQRAWWSIFSQDVSPHLSQEMILSCSLTGRSIPSVKSDLLQHDEISIPKFKFHDPWINYTPIKPTETSQSDYLESIRPLSQAQYDRTEPRYYNTDTSDHQIDSPQIQISEHKITEFQNFTNQKADLHTNHLEKPNNIQQKIQPINEKIKHNLTVTDSSKSFSQNFNHNTNEANILTHEHTFDCNKENSKIQNSFRTKNIVSDVFVCDNFSKTSCQSIPIDNGNCKTDNSPLSTEKRQVGRETYLIINNFNETSKNIINNDLAQTSVTKERICNKRTQQTDSLAQEKTNKDEKLFGEMNKQTNKQETYVKSTKACFLQSENGLSNEGFCFTGVAGALARGDAEQWRKEAWEAGDVDYLGRDSFSNIWQKICTSVGIAPQVEATVEAKEDKIPEVVPGEKAVPLSEVVKEVIEVKADEVPVTAEVAKPADAPAPPEKTSVVETPAPEPKTEASATPVEASVLPVEARPPSSLPAVETSKPLTETLVALGETPAPSHEASIATPGETPAPKTETPKPFSESPAVSAETPLAPAEIPAPPSVASVPTTEAPATSMETPATKTETPVLTAEAPKTETPPAPIETPTTLAEIELPKPETPVAPAEPPATPTGTPVESSALPPPPPETPSQPSPDAKVETPLEAKIQSPAVQADLPKPSEAQPAVTAETLKPETVPSPPSEQPTKCSVKPEECCGKPDACTLPSKDPVCPKPERKPKEQTTATAVSESAVTPTEPATPDITPPSGPGSPSIADAPLPDVSKLQATPSQPTTPPVGGPESSEPPVPPKRKAGKNGKPSPKGGKK